MDITFSIVNQTITRTDQAAVVAGSRGYLYAAFSFSDDWHGLIKTAQFKRDDIVMDMLLVNDRCTVPWELLAKQGIIQVTVFGGDLITVNQAAIPVQPTGMSLANTPALLPTPSYYAQVVQALGVPGPQGPQGPQGIQGAKGDKGDPGLDGSAVPIDDASSAADRVLSASYIKGQLSAIAEFGLTPIATYTHTLNSEYVISAIDVDADTFTCVAHGLADGNVIFPTINNDAGSVYPLQVYPGGLTQLHYYVVEKTNDTFKLSLTSGGAAINLTTNASLDLAKWHFEKSTTNIINITGLSDKRLFVKTFSKTSLPGQLYIGPVAPVSWTTNKFINGTVYAYPAVSTTGGGTYAGYTETLIISNTYHAILRHKTQTNNVNNSNAAALLSVIANTTYQSREATFLDTAVQTVRAYHVEGYFANGTMIEVYAV